MIERKFGRLLVLRETNKRKRQLKVYECRCDCGAAFEAVGADLRKGNTTSCGCKQREAVINRNKASAKHGHAGMRRTPTYNSWMGMHQRCNPKTSHPQYRKNYVARGITVCPEWSDYQVFLRDMGERPIGTSLDRVNNDAGYCKDNCRWASHSEQAANKRTTKLATIGTRTRPVVEWCKHFGTSYEAVLKRIESGIDPALAVQAPVMPNSKGQKKARVAAWVDEHADSGFIEAPAAQDLGVVIREAA